jgi:PhzF family phenazine biosynthesis protein
MIQLPSVEVLNALQPDMEAVASITRRHEAISFHPFVLGSDGYTAHVRDFAPAYGVPEESATGTANAALTHYLARHGIIGGGAECRFLQGEAMDRPSVVMTRLTPGGTIHVGGTSCILATGTLHI